MTSTNLPVVLLVGGHGTRMGADAGELPKHLVEIGGKPILWHVMKLYAHYGHTEFVFPLGYRGDLFRQYFLNYDALNRDVEFNIRRPQDRKYHDQSKEIGWTVRLFDAGIDTDKGSRVRKACSRLDADTVFVTYGDGIGDVDINALLEFHRGHGRLATLTGYQPLSQYGVLDVDSNGRVERIAEKPRLRQWINAGFFVFERGVADYLAGDDNIDLERDALARLAEDGQLMMYRHDGFWASMDTFKDAQRLNQAWDAGAPWKVWGE
ncbi:MAG: sugar phosphate nucleotidyltransferase [Anaerolineales bacterium]